ncbi:MAG: flagellar hook-length control protein FliK, partial [Rhodospirillaceae bacterium]
GAKTDKPGKDAKADKSDAADDAGATEAAEAADKAGDKDDADAAAKDADAAVAAVALPPDAPTVGDPILAVMPMAGQQMIAAKQTPGGGDAAPGKSIAAAGKGTQGPAAKAGPLLKGIDPRQVAAGQDAKAGDAAAGTDDAKAAGATTGPQSATSALNGFAAALGTTAAGPNGQAAMMQARGAGDMAPQTTAAQLVQAVEAAASGDGGGGADAGLRGDGGSGGTQSGAGTRIPDGTMAAGGIEATRETGGSDFAGTLASVRSARPGMPAGATDQVAVQLQHSAKDGNGSITMQLRPEELGRIDIKLDIDQQGMVNATITADRPQTLELLQRDSRSLEKALQDAGLQTDSSSLNFNLRGESGQSSNQQSFQGDGSRNPRNGQPQPAAIDDVAPVKLAVATQRYQVANGRIDVRI